MIKALVRLAILPLLMGCPALHGSDQSKENYQYLNIYTHFPPFTYFDEEDPQGIFFDLYREIFTRVGIGIRHEHLPIKRFYRATRHEADFTVSPYTFDMSDTHYRVETPLATLTLGQFYTSGEAPPKSFEDQRGMNILTVFGYRYDGNLTQKFFAARGIEAKSIKNRNTAAALLHAGHYDYLLEYHEIASGALQKNTLAALKFQPLKTTQMHLYFRKTAPQAKELIQRCEEVIQALRESGELDRVLRSRAEYYLSLPGDPEKPDTKAEISDN